MTFANENANNGNPAQNSETPLLSLCLFNSAKSLKKRSQKSGSFKNSEGNLNTTLNIAKMDYC